jgi:hypothetical protein
MKRLLAALAVGVVARMAFHALFLPAFEGPDEPHHLARAVAFARGPLREAFLGSGVDAAIIASVKAYPCAPALSRAYGCPAFGSKPAAFNLLRPAPPPQPTGGTSNPESNQPPLYYFLSGLLLRLALPDASPSAALLAMRMLSVALVALAVFGPLRLLAAHRPPTVAFAALVALLLPGASEALARCSNDAAVFLWSALVLCALERKTGAGRMTLLLAAGPLLKLTAIPIVVFAVVALFGEGRRRTAVAGALCSLSVFPVQLLRGWRWGGTVELNKPTPPIGEPFLVAAAGFIRSCYAFVKTTFWISGWSLLRPPRILTVFYVTLLVLTVLRWRPNPRPRRWAAHAAAFGSACAGFSAFAVANRRFYGGWGGVAGWYLWGWSPWIAVAATDLGTITPRSGRVLLWLEGLFVLAANVVWLRAHGSFYGW